MNLYDAGEPKAEKEIPKADSKAEVNIILTHKDTVKYYEQYVNFCETYLSSDIQNYYRLKKRQRLIDIGYSDNWLDKELNLDTMEQEISGPQKDLFDSYDMEPNDMDFELVYASNDEAKSGEIKMTTTNYTLLLEIIASFNVENAPGRAIRIGVREKNTNKFVGFIKLGSPVIAIKPRNEILQNTNISLDVLNRHCMNGFNIVPVQPFGYNYLGGKLMALLCICHEVRENWDKKYGVESALFETTSLYGSIKEFSQYDGMRPYIRYKGNTESKLLLNLPDQMYLNMRDEIQEKYNDGQTLVPDDQLIPTSTKFRTQSKILSILKNSLKKYDPNKFKHLQELTQSSMSITTQKRYYTSDFGYGNNIEYIMGKNKELKRGQNYDKFSFENVVKWWKRKAQKRYEKIKSEGRLRTELEFWTPKTIDTIDIIR